MGGPGIFHQESHERADRHRVARMVKKSDREESEHHWMRCTPEPEILMKEVQGDAGGEERGSHG